MTAGLCGSVDWWVIQVLAASTCLDAFVVSVRKETIYLYTCV